MLLAFGSPAAYKRPSTISLLNPVPSLPRTLIGTVWIPKPLILTPLFKADMVDAT